MANVYIFLLKFSLQNSTLANYSVMDATMTQIPNNTSVIDTASMSSVGISTETPPPGIKKFMKTIIYF